MARALGLVHFLAIATFASGCLVDSEHPSRTCSDSSPCPSGQMCGISEANKCAGVR